MRVLVVESSAKLQNALCAELSGAGFAVDVVGNGRAGWVYASRNDYDVVVLELAAPEIDGLSVLRRLRAEGHQTHVLVLSDSTSVENRVETLRAGADDYLQKPFDFSELVARIQALARRRYACKNPILSMGRLRIDAVRRQASVGDAPIDLTPREFSLLHYLALRRGEVVSRIEIEDRLYNEHSLPNSNSVESAVCLLRRKLRVAGWDRAIETRRGGGYLVT